MEKCAYGFGSFVKGWKIGMMVLVVAFSFGLASCEKEGPAEKAGKKVDNAMEKVGDQLEKAGDKVEQATDKANQ
jgi:hypothetical protein